MFSPFMDKYTTCSFQCKVNNDYHLGQIAFQYQYQLPSLKTLYLKDNRRMYSLRESQHPNDKNGRHACKSSNVLENKGLFENEDILSRSFCRRNVRAAAGIVRSSNFDENINWRDPNIDIQLSVPIDKILTNGKGCLNLDRPSSINMTNSSTNISEKPEIVYRDGIFGFFFLKAIFFMFSIILRDRSIRKNRSYADFVRVSKQFLYTPMIEKKGIEIQEKDKLKMNEHSQVIVGYLRGMVLPGVKMVIDFLIRILSLRRASRICAFFTPLLFGWLIGPTKPLQVEIMKEEGNDRGRGSFDTNREGNEFWTSGVQITQCRYLHESSCKAACVKLCKLPTQEFFSQELNIPLTMVPDFTDSSCQMLFGKSPPKPTEEDLAIQQLLESKSPCILLEQIIKNAKEN